MRTASRARYHASAAAFIVGFLLMAAIPAWATSVYSLSRTLVTYNSVKYTNDSMAENAGASSSYQTTARASANVPAGRLGVQARLFKDSGLDYLCEQTGWYYNGAWANATWNTGIYGGSADNGNCGDGLFWSKGRTQVFMDSGYTTYDSYSTRLLEMND